MTISSHPYLKLLVAIVAGIVVGSQLDSWGWGVGTFAGFMFIFIWVASWIFGTPFEESKVPVTDELEALLDKLAEIGLIKGALPLEARGWRNSLDLYVQLKDFGDRSRLQVGDRRHAFIDAWQERLSQWKVQKYSSGNWEKLVDATLDVAKWLGMYTVGSWTRTPSRSRRLSMDSGQLVI